MKVLIEIDEGSYHKTIDNADDYVDYERVRESLQNGIPLNGTNGEVLKAVYPNEVVEMDSKYFKNHNQVITIDGSCYFIDSDWWNADYKGVE